MIVSPEPRLPCFYELDCAVMAYDWGRRGELALIHRLRRRLGYEVDGAAPAAELWIGAHPKAPGMLRSENAEALDRAIVRNPEHLLGAELAGRGCSQLPFLFKILDAARPLSIQAHPDRELARQLHARDPQNYPDDNHKPELAVCIEDMSALIGFRPPEEISRFCSHAPEMAALCSHDGQLFGEASTQSPPAEEGAARHWIRELYSNLIRSSGHEIQEAVRALRLRLDALSDSGLLRSEDELFLELVTLYGDRDPGVFCAYFLNHIDVAPGEALYLGPNEPHAYLGGAMLECMAASDNVVRAGLTGKFCDVETLLSMLHYGHQRPQTLKAEPWMDRIYRYPAPASEFELRVLELDRRPLALPAQRGPAVLLSLAEAFRVECFRKDSMEMIDTLEIAAGSPLFLPGDLIDRRIEVHLKSLESSSVHQVVVGSDF